jgi:3-hydroxy acid dehydrogenase/malonic semialdehyde reductase
MNRIKGKLIVITGASSGIGRACAEQCASCGANLVLTARRIERLQELKSRLEQEHPVSVDIHKLDVRERADVRSFADNLKKSSRFPDVLINNAGLASGFALIQEGDFEDWDRMIDTNIKGLLNVSRTLIPLMVEKGSGHVVNVGSIAGYQVYPRGNVYNATKFAVRALTAGMNLDLAGTKIRVSSVSPGAVHTEFSQVRFHGDRERAEQVYRGYEPLQAGDVADAVLYIINAPEHVNIQELIIIPTAQRNVYVWDRGGS